MLKPMATRSVRAPGGHFAIVASNYNGRYVDSMLRAARKELARSRAESVSVFRVPGAFEIPVVAAKLAASHQPGFEAIICLGVIFRGETVHAQQIGDAVSYALAQIQIDSKLPIVHGVYLFEDQEQARVRCLGKTHNRGLETARTALEMAKVMKSL